MISLLNKCICFIEILILRIKNHQKLKLINIGINSKLYKESVINNFTNNPDKIIIGNNTHIRGELLVFNYGGKIKIGDNSFIGDGTRIWSGESVEIGSNVLISHNVNIIDSNSHEINHDERAKGFKKIILSGHPHLKGNIKTSPIIIEDYVWINFNVIILKGVTIGKGAIIGAGSVVLQNVEPFTLVAGNPAKFIKKVSYNE